MNPEERDLGAQVRFLAQPPFCWSFQPLLLPGSNLCGPTRRCDESIKDHVRAFIVVPFCPVLLLVARKASATRLLVEEAQTHSL